MIEYWELRGYGNDTWLACDSSTERWYEKNCTMQPGIEMAIWEPCNYVSNLAYDRLVVEICNQENWTIDSMFLRRIAETFSLVTYGSSFYHGSETFTGRQQDTMSNDLFTFILHQASMINIPYDPVIHDLSETPRKRSSTEMVEYWLDVLNTKNVTEWSEAFREIDGDLPTISFTFSGIFGHIFLLEFGLNASITIGEPFMDLLGVSEKSKRFIFDKYLPALDDQISHIKLSLEEKAELSENTLGTAFKLLYAFFWQEGVIDLGGLNLTPEINTAGAVFTPKLNMIANNFTRWDLFVEDVQLGGGYPGHEGCNNVIPHCKWHAQTAASLSDMTRLMDFVLHLENKHTN